LPCSADFPIMHICASTFDRQRGSLQRPGGWHVERRTRRASIYELRVEPGGRFGMTTLSLAKIAIRLGFADQAPD
jgi:hypothetical protein